VHPVPLELGDLEDLRVRLDGLVIWDPRVCLA